MIRCDYRGAYVYQGRCTNRAAYRVMPLTSRGRVEGHDARNACGVHLASVVQDVLDGWPQCEVAVRGLARAKAKRRGT